MTDIPATAREFRRWYDECEEDWPKGLRAAGVRALLSLDYLDQPAENRSRSLDEKARKDLIAFAVAFGEWKAHRERQNVHR